MRRSARRLVNAGKSFPVQGFPFGGRYEFSYLTPLAARLNHGSFGAAPASVLDEQARLRAEWMAVPKNNQPLFSLPGILSEIMHHACMHHRTMERGHPTFGKLAILFIIALISSEPWVLHRWMAHPDAGYFTGRLDDRLREAAGQVAELVSLDPAECLLVENATVAAAVIAQRWMWDYVEGRARKGDGLLLLNYRYGAVEYAMRQIVERAGARIVLAPLRFPCRSEDELLEVLGQRPPKKQALFSVAGILSK